MDTQRVRALAHGVLLRASRTAFYDADDTGRPTDPDLLEVWEAALDAQVRAWEAAHLTEHIVTGGATLPAGVASTSNQGASLTFDASTASAAIRHLVAGGIAPEAEFLLEQVGLTGGLPGVWR